MGVSDEGVPRLRVVSPVTMIREQVTTAIREEFKLPVLPVPRGNTISARVARIEHTSDGQRVAVVVGREAVHLVSVDKGAESLVGKRVDLRHDGGIARVKLLEREAQLTRDEGFQLKPRAREQKLER